MNEGIWNGETVLKKAPKRCPKCRSKALEVGYLPDFDEYDEERAEECGIERDEWDSRFAYTYETFSCDECDHWQAYGPRLYFDPVSGDYDENAKPLTPREQYLLELKQQEEAGQLRLL